MLLDHLVSWTLQVRVDLHLSMVLILRQRIVHGLTARGLPYAPFVIRGPSHGWNSFTQRSLLSTRSTGQYPAPPSVWSHMSLFTRIAAGAYVLQLYVANLTLVRYTSNQQLRLSTPDIRTQFWYFSHISFSTCD